jgi:Domain of unknown function (DUF4296)
MRKLTGALFILCLFSCISKNNPPSGIIQTDSMRSIMWDMIQADQYAKQYLAKDSGKINIKQETLSLYQEVFAIHHTTREEFEQSYQYYLAHQDLNKLIFDSLSARNMLERHRPVFYSAPKPPIKFQK